MKSFKSTAWILPPLGRRTLAHLQEPVLIIGTYDKGGACDVDNITGGHHGKPNAMNAAWGGQWDMHEIIISLGSHQTTDKFRPDKMKNMRNTGAKIMLVPLESDDREQFIIDNQRTFKYGAQEEFFAEQSGRSTSGRLQGKKAEHGMRDDRVEEGQEVISRKTIERCIDGNQAETYRIVCDGNAVGGLILQIDQQSAKGELEIMFIHPEAHSKGIGQAAWKAVEEMHPEIRVWEAITPYFEKRNIHFYVNRLGFQIVEFWNKYQHGSAVPEDLEEDDGEHQSSWSEDDEMFRFQKIM